MSSRIFSRFWTRLSKLSVMPGSETDGASGGSSDASISSGRTSFALIAGYLEPFNPKGEPHTLSQGWKRKKKSIFEICTLQVKEFRTTHRKEICFYM